MTVQTLEATSIAEIIDKLKELKIPSSSHIRVSIEDESSQPLSGNGKMNAFLKKVHQTGGLQGCGETIRSDAKAFSDDILIFN
jgi:hypothetical protein